jgi:hypothetical protein
LLGERELLHESRTALAVSARDPEPAAATPSAREIGEHIYARALKREHVVEPAEAGAQGNRCDVFQRCLMDQVLDFEQASERIHELDFKPKDTAVQID